MAAALTAGCSSDPPAKPGAVAVSGAVQRSDGKPVQNVTLNILPTSSDQNSGAAVLKKDGKFDLKLVPGRYTFMIEGQPAALKGVPAKYHENKAENTIEVPPGGGDLTIRLEG